MTFVGFLVCQVELQSWVARWDSEFDLNVEFQPCEAEF